MHSRQISHLIFALTKVEGCGKKRIRSNRIRHNQAYSTSTVVGVEPPVRIEKAEVKITAAFEVNENELQRFEFRLVNGGRENEKAMGEYSEA